MTDKECVLEVYPDAQEDSHGEIRARGRWLGESWGDVGSIVRDCALFYLVQDDLTEAKMGIVSLMPGEPI